MGTMLGPILGAFLGRTTGIEWFNGLGEAVTIVTA